MTTQVKRPTKAQSMKVLRDVCSFFGYSPNDEDAPTLIMDWDWLGYGGRPSIVWEEGPYEWAITYAGRQLLGMSDTWVEPMTSWSLNICRTDQ